MSSQFRGLGVAMVTPFTPEGKVDLDGLSNLTHHIVSNNADYLVVQGTTGEAATLSEEEKDLVLGHIQEVNNDRVPVVLGYGGNNTQAMLDGLDEKDLSGVDALLIASPYYNKPSQEGMYLHYKALSEKSPLPIILYNVPGRTGSNILPETVARLGEECDNIIAIKEASGDMEQVMRLIEIKPKSLSVLSGEDPLTLPIIAAGGEGVISVVGNAYPRIFHRMVWATLQGELKEARRDHYFLQEIIGQLFVEGNPAGIKEMLKHMGICGNTLRLPLANVGEKTSHRLLELSKKEIGEQV